MKRNESLAELSRDHHHGLVVAQRLKRATAQSAADARRSFLEFWASEGHEHFRVEEDVLLPAFARRGSPTHDAVVRVLTDHVDLRRRADDLRANADPTPEELHELGRRLDAHIRYEERTLFPLIEGALPEKELIRVARAIDAAHSQSS